MRARFILVPASILVGCASTSAAPAFRDVAQTAEERTGHRIHWHQADSDEKKVDRAVAALLSKPLSLDAAVQIALLRNPEIQATYEELSLARADFVQAGLLSNPVFSASVTTAERDAISPNLIFGVTESFLDALLIPAKRKVAAAELDAAKFRVGNAVLELAARVGHAYFAVAGAEQTLALSQSIADAERAASELVERQELAGNVGSLTVASERALYDQARIETLRAEAARTDAHEALTRLLGLSGRDVEWKCKDRLPDVPEREPSADDLQSRALRSRLDLAAMRAEVETLKYAEGLARTSRWTGLVDIGADVARLKNGSVVVGPRASIELPLFDQRQATVARLEAQTRVSERLLSARALEVLSDVRDAQNRVLSARAIIARYKEDVIPHRERVVTLSEQQYDAMLGGIYQLISAKQSEMASYREYIAAVRDYWIAKTDLECAIGGASAAAAVSERTTQPVAVSPNPSR